MSYHKAIGNSVKTLGKQEETAAYAQHCANQNPDTTEFASLVLYKMCIRDSGKVLSNFTDISNLADFKGGKVFVRAYFKVISTGETTVDLNLCLLYTSLYRRLFLF